MRTISAAVATIILSLASTAAAQRVEGLASSYVDPVDGLTLDQAIGQALEREPSLRAARAGIDVATGLERQASLRTNPSVALERRQVPGGLDRQSMVTVQWPLELFRRGPRMEVAAYQRDVAAASAADRERLLAAEARARYGQLLVSIRRLAVLDELVAVVSEQYRLVSARVMEGAAPALDRDLLDVELRRWRADRLVAQGRTDAAVVALNRVRGLPPDAQLRIRHRLADVVARARVLDGADAVDEAARPDVRAAAAAVDASEARRDAARADGRIDVSLMGGYARMQSGFMLRGVGPDGGLAPIRNRMNAFTAGVMVMVPLFNRNQGAVAAASAERSAAEAALEAVRLDVRADVASAAVVDRRAREALELFTAGARELAQRNLAVVQQTYELGRVTVFDVLTEQRRYLAFEDAYTDALRLAFEARTSLLSARGEVR
jgi:cobalt-zinc-cadmium efflux system outer membrane protein